MLCEFLVSDEYKIPDSQPSDGMDILKTIMDKADESLSVS